MGDIELSFDWLAFTFPKQYLDTFYTFIDDKPVLLERGYRGYECSAMILSKGYVAWSVNNPKMNNTAHVSLSSQPLALFKKGDTGAVIDLMKWVLSIGGHFTRYDIAYDDKSGIVTVEDVNNAWDAGNRVTRFENKQYKEGKKGDVISEKSLHIGSMESLSFLRVYDKALEQGIEGHWTRFETVLKDELATAYAGLLVNAWEQGETFFSEICLGVLRGLIEFKDLHSDKNPCRRKPLSWWSGFVGDVKKVKVVRVKEQLTIEKIRDWIEYQVAPSLAVLKESNGLGHSDYMSMVYASGKKRLRASHLAMLQSG